MPVAMVWYKVLLALDLGGCRRPPLPEQPWRERESSRRCLPLGPEGPLPATGVGLIFFAFCYSSPTPFSRQGNSDAASGGASGSISLSLLRRWWFSEAALALEPEGWHSGYRGRADWGGGEG